MTRGRPQDALFTGTPTIEAHLPDAEVYVSPLSRYVLDELPQDLRAIRQGTLSYEDLQTKQQTVLESAAVRISTNTDPFVAEITQLDLAFMLGGYLPVKHEEEFPPLLVDMLRQQASEFECSPYMDYDLIINVNSEEYLRTGRMRTFLDGDKAAHERDFYLGHYKSEVYMKEVAQALQDLVDAPHCHDPTTLLEQAANNMQTFREYMQAYLRLSAGAFGELRPYLDTYPDGTRNASGAFMPSVQLAELSLHRPSEAHTTYIEESLPYFPRHSRLPIEIAHALSLKGANVVDCIRDGILKLDEAGHAALEFLLQQFILFRQAHHAAARKYVPEAFPAGASVSRAQLAQFGEPDILEGNVKGTAGFDVQNVLGGSIFRLLRLEKQLQELQ